MSGSFITNLVKRGSGLAFPAIKPNSLPYFPLMPASPGQGNRPPFARIFSGILPRISDIRGLPDSMNMGELPREVVTAGRSVGLEFEGMRDTDQGEAPDKRNSMMKSPANANEKVQSTPFWERSQFEAPHQSQPDYETPDVTPSGEATVISTVAGDKKLKEAEALADLQSLQEISLEVRADSVQVALPSKAELAKQAPLDSPATGPQIERKEIIPDSNGRDLNIVSTASIPRISGDAYSLTEREADQSEIEDTESPGPEPELMPDKLLSEIRTAESPGQKTNSISLTPKGIVTELLPGPDGKSMPFKITEVKPAAIADQKEVATELLAGPDGKSMPFTVAEVKLGAVSDQKKIRTAILPGSGQKSTSQVVSAINVAKPPGLVPELPSRQSAINIAESKDIASILDQSLALERSSSAIPIERPRYSPERSFIPEARPEVHISIGTIEVRADTKPEIQSAELPPENPGPFGFDEYAQIRRYISWER